MSQRHLVTPQSNEWIRPTLPSLCRSSSQTETLPLVTAALMAMPHCTGFSPSHFPMLLLLQHSINHTPVFPCVEFLAVTSVHASQAPKWHLNRFSYFCKHCYKGTKCFSMEQTTPQKCPFPREI